MKRKIILLFLLMFSLIALSGCSSLNVFQYYVYDDTNYNIGNKAYNEIIEEINIDWIVGNVYIVQSSNHEIIIREETDIEIEDKFKMHYKLDNQILDIKFAGSNAKLNYSYKIKDLYVFLPSQMNKIQINNVSSDININNVQIKDLEIDNVSGDIQVEKSKINEIGITNVSGEIIILDNEINSIEIETTSGNIGLSFAKMPHELDLSSISANITIYIESIDSISVEFSTISGNFKSNLEYTTKGDTYIFNGSKENEYDVDTISGNLIINKK